MDQYILSLSYGKDSLACLGAIEQLGWPLDRIVHAEVWATDDIPADLPPMVEFKSKADEWIKEHFGVEVEHIFATRERESNSASPEREKLTYEKIFYRERQLKRGGYQLYGFPIPKGPWCNGYLKRDVLNGLWVLQRGGVSIVPEHSSETSSVDYGLPDTLDAVLHGRTQSQQTHGFSGSALNRGADINIVQYLGIAADEPARITRHTKPGFLLPLVEVGWDEAYCRRWCEERGLLSPIYESATRGGCWFCHNQKLDQLRDLRRDYPDLWGLLLKWDLDSPTTFCSNGRTVHDLDRRFQAEDDGLIPTDARFRWKMLDQLNSENCSE